MKIKLLTLSILSALTVNAYADDVLVAPIFDANGEKRSFFEGVGGTFGASIEFNETTTKGSNGQVKAEEKETTNEVGQVYLANSQYNFTALYSLKTTHKTKREKYYWMNEDGLKHLLLLNKGFYLGNGFTTGFQYEAEYSDNKILASDKDRDFGKTMLEQLFKPYMLYSNAEYGVGVYSHFEYRLMDLDHDDAVWGKTEETSYSLLVRPTYQWGNFEFGFEMFHQVKDSELNNQWTQHGSSWVDGNGNPQSSGGFGVEKGDFTETYIEPSVTYAFEDYGTLYARMRIGESTTTTLNGDNKDNEYYTDILKTTVGYEQAVGDSWLVKGEYEYTRDSKSGKLASGHKFDGDTVEGHTIYLHGLYRF